MSYTLHNFKSGDTLMASQLNEMDEQINETKQDLNHKFSQVSESIVEISELMPTYDELVNVGYPCTGGKTWYSNGSSGNNAKYGIVQPIEYTPEMDTIFVTSESGVRFYVWGRNETGSMTGLKPTSNTNDFSLKNYAYKYIYITVDMVSGENMQSIENAIYISTRQEVRTKCASQAQVDDLSDGIKAIDEIDFNFVDGSYISSSGSEIAHGMYSHTDYVPISAYYSIEFPMFFSSGARCVIYDENKKVVDVISNDSVGAKKVYELSASASYMRCTCLTANKNVFYISAELHYMDKVIQLANPKVETEEKPNDNIITDGGFCKIFRTIGVVGDSLSSGEMAYGGATDESTTQYVDMYEYSWLQYIARTCGSVGHNFSKGGLSTRTFFTAENGKYYNMLMDGEHKCQAYFIALGHNDRNGSVPIGSASDISISNPDSNADTYYGNYAKIISKIKAIQPNAKIFCVCMKQSSYFSAYNTAIRNIATMFSNVYVLDMERYFPTFEHDWEYTQGHGNPMGYLNYSYQIASYVDWIIRHNRADFKYVQFIGTDKEQYIPTN